MLHRLVTVGEAQAPLRLLHPLLGVLRVACPNTLTFKCLSLNLTNRFSNVTPLNTSITLCFMVVLMLVIVSLFIAPFSFHYYEPS